MCSTFYLNNCYSDQKHLWNDFGISEKITVSLQIKTVLDSQQLHFVDQTISYKKHHNILTETLMKSQEIKFSKSNLQLFPKSLSFFLFALYFAIFTLQRCSFDSSGNFWKHLTQANNLLAFDALILLYFNCFS